MENYFNIPDSENCICTIEKYGRIHPALAITISTIDGKILGHIDFILPAYIESPMSWRGANFRLGNDAERLDLADSRHLHETINHYRLFVVYAPEFSGTQYHCRILALKGEFHDRQS